MFYNYFKIKYSSILFFTSLIFSLLQFQNSYAQDNYEIGLGIYDITGEIAESNFFGYASPTTRNNGIRDRQYARAYIIKEPNETPVVFVCIDKGGMFQSVNKAVMEKLRATYGDLYNDENVVISATHTHVSSGGFSHFMLYELATGGYWKNNFNNLVDGIYGSIVRAHNTISPGRIYINKGNLTNASINRSLVAYDNNTDAANFSSIDEEMTVLKFLKSEKEVGMISWFGVHPTSLSMTYSHNSADNKGYAALKFERLKNASYEESDTFIAAFANTNAGDLSPNLNLPPANDPNQNATGPGVDEEDSANIMGERQYIKALELYNTATTQLTGSIKAISRYTDFSNVSVAPRFTNGDTENTCIAALGISFTAGAEDGRSGLGIFEGITKNPNIGNEVDQCHTEKPIAPLFLLGENENDPATPKILPTSILKIGQFGILAAPAEFTVMSGRRARATVENVNGIGITETVLAGYSDAYAGYVTTREEYASQQYEGASTHFGPWTLAAYRQEFERLAKKLVQPNLDPWPVEEPAIPFKAEPIIDVTTTIAFDTTPSSIEFGDIDTDVQDSYQKGTSAEVIFWGAHPNNDLKTNKTYLTVEFEEENGDWTVVYSDRDPITKLTWERFSVADSKIKIRWDIPEDATTGFYRIKHFGKSKPLIGNLNDYSGCSSRFFVGGTLGNDSSLFTSSLFIYPNPNQGDINLIVKNNFTGFYEIMDLFGRKIQADKIESNGLKTINLNQTSGIYFLNVTHITGQKYTYKLIRE